MSKETNPFIETLTRLHVSYGSCKIIWDTKKNQKKPIFKNKWDSAYDASLSGAFVKTGPESNICVIDLDDMESKSCQTLQKMCDDCCNLKVKTRKGYHYYFKYNENFKATNHCNEHHFDIQSSNAIVFCPPSSYNDGEGNTIKYICQYVPDENQELNEMSDELQKQLVDYITSKNSKMIKKIMDKKPKTIKNKSIDIEMNEIIDPTEKVKKTELKKLPDEKMRFLLSSLDKSRADNLKYWIIVGLALKNDGYKCDLWDEFSQRVKNKYDKGDTYYSWRLFKNKEDVAVIVTTGTLIFWLKTDNKKAYDDLSKFIKIDNYDQDMGKIIGEKFNNNIMQRLLVSDVEYFGISTYKESYSISKSYKYFNTYHFHSSHNNCYYKIDTDNGLKTIIYLPQLEGTYIHFTGKINFIQIWKLSFEKQIYDYIDFCPDNKCENTTYNTFTGFAYHIKENITQNIINNDNTKTNFEIIAVTKREKSIEPLLDHLKYLCNNDGYYDYLIKWVAHIRQKPHIKTGVAIVLYSDIQGSGKNTAVDIITGIFKGYKAVINERDLNARFNKKMESKLILYGDEIKGSKKQDADNIKNLLTAYELSIEPKGKEAYTMKDYSNYIFTTNNSISFKIEATDRRFALIHCVEKKKDSEYYENIYKLLNDIEIMQNLDSYLRNLDISTFNVRIIPKCDYKKENILYSLPGHIQMVRLKPEDFCGQTFSPDDLVRKANAYSQQLHLSSTFTKMKILKDLSNYFSFFHKKTKTGMKYIFPANLSEIIDDIIIAKI